MCESVTAADAAHVAVLTCSDPCRAGCCYVNAATVKFTKLCKMSLLDVMAVHMCFQVDMLYTCLMLRILLGRLYGPC